MGTIIEVNRLPDEKEMNSRLLVYYKQLKQMTAVQSVSRPIAEGLAGCRPNRRSMKLEQIFNRVLDQYPDGVTVRDIDVMFNPAYQVDVLKILIAARKRKWYSVIWPGRCEDGKLLYSEEGYPDYKTFDIGDYDVTCVIGGYDK